jgi:hypothetical protein
MLDKLEIDPNEQSTSQNAEKQRLPLYFVVVCKIGFQIGFGQT